MIARGIFAIFATYFYFLLFAQFAFLELVKINIEFTYLQAVMASMGLSGLIFSLLSIKLLEKYSAERLILFGFISCAITSLLSLQIQSLPSFLVVAALIGSTLAVLTVSLATALDSFFPLRRIGLLAGIGTGLAYFSCNIPLVFNATLEQKSYFVSIFCLLAAFSFIFKFKAEQQDLKFNRSYSWLFIFAFLALVWFDSAAFFVIQQASELKAITWQGSSKLWSNAAIHLLTAVAAGLLIDKYYFSNVLVSAFIFLVLGVSALTNDYSYLSAPFYCAGVSLYSTALVVFPSLILSNRKKSFWAGVLYSFAGWFGSAMGIGMAQDLRRVPISFMIVAGIIVFGIYLISRKKHSTLALFLFLLIPSLSYSQEGRQVYIQEGCINCHSQYVRPNSEDVEMWGPVVAKEKILADIPPLIGNRRLGPDLLNVGNRRSPEWLELHMIYPQELSPGSRMPSYKYLFEDSRGKALVEYLKSLGQDTIAERSKFIYEWQASATKPISIDEAKKLYQQSCAQCHEDQEIAKLFRTRPTDLSSTKYHYVDKNSLKDLSRVIKFGILGTSMPGHEYFNDAQILGLARFLQEK